MQAVSPTLSAIDDALGSFQLEGSQDQFPRRFEQFLRKRDQLIRRQPTMTLVHRFGQRV